MDFFTTLLGLVIAMIVANVALVGLALWIGYRLVISAIKTAIRETDQERAQRAQWSGGYSSDSTR